MTTPTIDNTYQTNLLFKRFTGVAATKLDNEFSSENFKSVPNIFSKDVMIEDVPSSAPLAIAGPTGLDASANWADSSYNYVTNNFEESTYYNVNDPNDPSNNMTFAQMFPDSNLKFYKRLSLVPVLSGEGGRVWGCFTDYSGNPMYRNKESVLAHTIPFKFDDILNTYVPIVRYNAVFPLGSAGQQNQTKGAGTSTDNFSGGNAPLNADPLYWIMDAGTGYLQLYATQEELEAVGVEDKKVNGIQDPSFAPIISCFVYNGKLGITDLDVSGQVQVGDISGLGQLTGNLERIVLPDGSANVFDICANDAVRSQYNYTRGNLFVGHRLVPIIDNSNVNHLYDPSHNDAITGTTKTYTFDISGDSHFEGSLVHRSCSALDETCIAFGNGSKAMASVSYAHGTGCDASGVSSHAEGTLTSTSAGASASHAEGFFTKTYGVYSHAEGNNSEAHGQSSHASGLHTIIGTDAGTSIGQFNDLSQNVFFVVGDGINNFSRSDAFYIEKDSNNKGQTVVNRTLTVNESTRLRGDVDVSGAITADGAIISNDNIIGISGEKGTFVQLSAIDSTISNLQNQMDTFTLINTVPPGLYTPQNPPPNRDWYVIAILDNRAGTPGTNSQVDNVAAYFTFHNNRNQNLNKQVIHFIAGIYYDNNEPKPYVKVLSNACNINGSRVGTIAIVGDSTTSGTSAPNNEIIYLMLGMVGPNPMEDCEIRMYKNGYGDQAPSLDRGWIMGHWRPGSTYTPTTNGMDIFEIANQVITYPSGQPWNTYLYLDIDTTPIPNAYSTLFETFTKDVDVKAGLRVGGTAQFDDFVNILRDLTVVGQIDASAANIVNTITAGGDITTTGNIYGNNIEASGDISAVNLNLSGTINAGGSGFGNIDALDICANFLKTTMGLHIELDVVDNSGLLIKNDGAGYPQITLVDNNLPYQGIPTYKYINVGGQGPFRLPGSQDDLNLELGSDELQVTAAASGVSQHAALNINNTNSSGATRLSLKGGGQVLQGSTPVGANTGLDIINNLNSDNKTSIVSYSTSGTGKGLTLGSKGSLNESDWYIGGRTEHDQGRAIKVACLTNDTNGHFESGEVVINAPYGNPINVQRDIDFKVNTETMLNAIHVDAGEDEIYFNAPVDASSASFVHLPSETIIKNRQYWPGAEAATFDLKVDGIEEYSFDTQNISNDGWMSIAYVGPPTIQTATLQRASATFEFLNNIGSVHQHVVVNVACIFGTGLSIDVIKNARFADGGNGNNRMIKAFRIAYGGTYDGGIFQMQIKDTGSAGTDIRLKITKNYNYYGWHCDLSGSPPLDNNPVYYNNGGGHGSAGTVGTPMPYNFPSQTGLNILERLQSFGSTGSNGVSAASDGKSTLFYTSDTVFQKIYISNRLDMSGNNILMNSGNIDMGGGDIEMVGGSIDMDGGNIDLNGGTISGLNLKLQPYSSLDDASGAIINTGAGSLAFATTTPTSSSGSFPFSNMLFTGGPGNKTYIVGSPTKVDFIVDWDGNSSGGTPFNLNSNGSLSRKTGSIIYDPHMYAATGVVKYWYPCNRGFYSSARLENLNTKLRFSNTTNSSQTVEMSVWIYVNSNHGGFTAMSQGNNANQYTCCLHRYTFTLPQGSNAAEKYFGNSSTGRSIKLLNNTPTTNSSGEIAYFDEDDYIGVSWNVGVPGGWSGGGNITVVPIATGAASGFNRSAASFQAHLTTELRN